MEKEISDCIKNNKILNFQLEQHANECPICNDLVTVSNWMGDFNSISQKYDASKKQLPDANFFWDAAHNPKTTKRFSKENVEKAMLPLLIPQALTYTALLVVAGLLAPEFFPNIKALFSNLQGSLSSALPDFLKSINLIKLPAIIITSSIILYFFYTIFDPEEA